MRVIQTASIDHGEISVLYHQAFDESEANVVSDLAISLLAEATNPKVISIAAVRDGVLLGHVAFSPVFRDDVSAHIGYILAPLAVLPRFQKSGIGSAMVKYGFRIIEDRGPTIVFVYGDPSYYSRFGFEQNPALGYKPPYELKYPEGWQVKLINASEWPKPCRIVCVKSLAFSELW